MLIKFATNAISTYVQSARSSRRHDRFPPGASPSTGRCPSGLHNVALRRRLDSHSHHGHKEDSIIIKLDSFAHRVSSAGRVYEYVACWRAVHGRRPGGRGTRQSEMMEGERARLQQHGAHTATCCPRAAPGGPVGPAKSSDINQREQLCLPADERGCV
jgi:hypothetical protein